MASTVRQKNAEAAAVYAGKNRRKYGKTDMETGKYAVSVPGGAGQRC